MHRSKKETLKRSLEDIRTLIQAFVEQLTEDQYESLKTGSPNNSTRIQLAKLLIDILTSLSKMCKNHNSRMTEKKVIGLLGNSLAQMFATVLKAEEAASSADVETLNRLIGAEVTEMVKSEQSDVSGHMIAASRLNMMVEETFKMLQSFEFSQEKDQQNKLQDVKPASVVGHQLVDEREWTEDREPSPAGFLSRPHSHVGSVLMEELNGITSPLLQDVPVAQAQVVISQTSEEMKVVLADLTEHKVKSRRAFKSAMAKVKTFFTKTFAKALIHCKVAELKADHQSVPQVESKTSLQMLAENIDTLLNSLQSKGVRQESECLFSCDDPNFTGQLFDVIHKGVIETEDNETAMEARLVLDPDHGSIEADIRDKMNKFLVLTSWWMNTQLGSCCERVMITLKHSQKWKPQALGSLPEQPISQDAKVKPETGQDEEEEEMSDQLKVEGQAVSTPLQSEIREPKTHKSTDLDVKTLLDQKMKEVKQNKLRIYIETLVQLLVGRLVHKAKFAVEEQDCIIQTLSKATFTRLEQCASIELDPRRLTDLQECIYKDLCRDLGSAENILFGLATDDQSVVSCAATMIQYHITCTKKSGLICKWVKYIANMFRTCTR